MTFPNLFSFYKKIIIFAIISAVPLHLMSSYLDVWQMAVIAGVMFLIDLTTTIHLIRRGFSESSPWYQLVNKRFQKKTMIFVYAVTYGGIITVCFVAGIGPELLVAAAALHAFAAISNCKIALYAKKSQYTMESKI